MSRTVAFGIVGGYGATGKVVLSELSKSCEGKILIGGRDLAKGTALAEELGKRVSAAHLAVLNGRSLDDFCSQCSIIVNCAGPVMVLQDRVAQAAFRRNCHYIDVAGLTFVKERMLPHSREIADLGLSFVVSAGWMPGISELVPVYANAQARTQMDTIESLTVFFGDSGERSDNALRDAAWYVHQAGLRSPAYFHRGERSRAKMSATSRNIDLGDPIGRGRFTLVSLPGSSRPYWFMQTEDNVERWSKESAS
jgi:saccharopine dehydrogenase-like NADP-dependent oxidoreductase